MDAIEHIIQQNKEESEESCDMNQLTNCRLDEIVGVYECPECKMDNICYKCLQHHSDHSNTDEWFAKASILRENFECSCARVSISQI